MTHKLLLIVLLPLCLSTTALAQKAKFQGLLLNEQGKPEGRVQIKILPERKGATTDNNGRFKVFFYDIGPGEPINIEVERADWIVFEPLFGRATTQDIRGFKDGDIPVRIAKKGSKILLSPDQILNLIRSLEQELNRGSRKVARLESQNVDLRRDVRRLEAQNATLNSEAAAIALERERESRDITVFLDRYASVHGFTRVQVLSAVVEWAKPRPTDSQEATLLKLLWNKQYQAARELALQGAQKRIENWKLRQEQQAEMKKQNEEEERLFVVELSLGIVAAYRERRYRETLDMYGRLTTFFTENKIPADRFSVQFANARGLSANAKAFLARDRRGGNSEAKQLLTEAIADYRELLSFYTVEKHPRDWAGTHLNLGNALQDLVFTVGGPGSYDHLKEAERAYREAIKIRSLEAEGGFCGCSELNLGVALHSLALLGGPETLQFFKDAEKAYSDAVRRVSSVDQPEEWSWLQRTLGRVLQDLGRMRGPNHLSYFKQAEGTFRQLIATSEREKMHPCSCNHVGLGSVLHDLGKEPGEDRLKYLMAAQAAYETALMLNSREELLLPPVEITIRMAGLYQDLSKLPGRDSFADLKQAETYLKSLFGPQEGQMFPADRVWIRSSMSRVLQDLAELLPGDARSYLKESEKQARDAVLLSKELAIPNPCGCTLVTLGTALQTLGRLDEPRRLDNFKEAESLYRDALNLTPATQSPFVWAFTQALIGDALLDRAEFDELQRRKHLEDAVKAFKQAISIQVSPAEHDRLKLGLARALMNLGLTFDPVAVEYLKESESVLRTITPATLYESPEDRVNYHGILGAVLHAWAHAETPLNFELLKKSEEAFRIAKELFKYEENATGWIKVRIDLTEVVLDLVRDEASAGEQLKYAESIYRELFARDFREAYFEDWLKGQRGFVTTLQGLSELRGEDGLARLEEAAALLRDAVKLGLPNDQEASFKYELAEVLEALAKLPEDREPAIKYLEEAKTLQQSLLELTKPETDLVDWSESMCRIATVTQKLANETEDLGQLIEAERIFREASKAELRERDKPQWIHLQFGLGDVLANLGQVDRAKRRRYLKEAMRVYDEALKVGTKDSFPDEWAKLNIEKADVLDRLNDPLAATRLLTKVFDHDPKNDDALAYLISLYHERLFEFERAFILNQELRARQGDSVSVQTNFAENSFTTGRFDECEILIRDLLGTDSLDEDEKIALRAIEIASLLGNDKTSEVPAKLNLLITEVERQPPDFWVNWRFDGAKRFSSGYKPLTRYRAWLMQLFDAVQEDDRDTILNALRDLRSKLDILLRVRRKTV